MWQNATNRNETAFQLHGVTLKSIYTPKKYELCSFQALGILILLVYQLASDIGFQTRKDIDQENLL